MQSEKPFSDQIQFIKLYKAELILLFVTFVWGLSFPLIKISLQFISPLLLTLIRFIITFIIFYLVFRKKLDLSKFNEWKFGVILGFFLSAGFAFQAMGLKHTSVSKSAFITGTVVVMIPFVQYFILKTKPKTENIVGAFIVMIGLYILSEAYFTDINFGDILTLICAVFFSIHVVLLDKYSKEVNFYLLAFGLFLSLVVFTFIFMTISEVLIYKDIFIMLNSELLLSIIFVSLFSTFIGIILMTKYQGKTTPLRAAIIYNMESVFAVFFAYILLKEILSYNQFIGIIIMVTGLAISEFYMYFKFRFSDEKKI